MNDFLKRKLESLSKEDLLHLIEELCRNEENRKVIKLLVSPSTQDLDDLFRSFHRWCNSYDNGSRSEKTIKNLYAISSLLFASSEKFGAKKSAETAYGMYKECEDLLEYDDDVIVDIIYDAKYILENTLKNHKPDFTAEEIKKYSYIVEDD